MKLQPCHRQLAELWFKFGDGLELKWHLMGPKDRERLAESLKKNALWVQKITELEMLLQAARAGRDSEWVLEIVDKMTRQYLNVPGGS